MKMTRQKIAGERPNSCLPHTVTLLRTGLFLFCNSYTMGSILTQIVLFVLFHNQMKMVELQLILSAKTKCAAYVS